MRYSMRGARAVAIGLCGFTATFAQAGSTPSFFVESVGVPVQSSLATNFEIVLEGDQTQNIADNANPFPAPNNFAVMYNAMTNESTLTYSGPALSPLGTYNFGFGLDGGGEPPILGQHFTTLGGGQTGPDLPVVVVTAGTIGPATITEWGIAFVAAKDANGDLIFSLTEYEITGVAGSPTDLYVNLYNPTNELETIESAGFMVSPRQIPLEDLTPNGFGNGLPPIGGIPGGAMLAPGQTITGYATPEPSSLVLAVIGALGYLGFASCKSRRRQ
jgi:PEP-CTERM motif